MRDEKDGDHSVSTYRDGAYGASGNGFGILHGIVFLGNNLMFRRQLYSEFQSGCVHVHDLMWPGLHGRDHHNEDVWR